MASALVKAINAERPAQFRTKWSEFMKQVFSMKLMMYPESFVLDKSDAKLTYNLSVPKILSDLATPADAIFFCVYLKDDANVVKSVVVEKTWADFATAAEHGGEDFLKLAAALELAVTGANITATKHYDVNVVFSDKEINLETVENPGDEPYTVYGKACAFVVDVTAVA